MFVCFLLIYVQNVTFVQAKPSVFEPRHASCRLLKTQTSSCLSSFVKIVEDFKQTSSSLVQQQSFSHLSILPPPGHKTGTNLEALHCMIHLGNTAVAYHLIDTDRHHTFFFNTNIYLTKKSYNF